MIEIFLLYESEFRNDEINFKQLVQNENSLDNNHSVPDFFWGVSGGLQILVDNYNLIFNSTDFPNLVKVTNFLLHSLYWSKNIKCNRFDEDDFYPKDVVLRTTSKNLLRLQKSSDNELILSFTHQQKDHVRQRGERYFDNFQIKQKEWEIAAYQALKEYFEILMRIAKEDSNNNYSNTMIEYHKVFSALPEF